MITLVRFGTISYRPWNFSHGETPRLDPGWPDQRDDSLNVRYRRAVKVRGHFPTRQSAMRRLHVV